MFKIRRILFVLIVGTVIWLLGPMLFKSIILGRVNATFTRFGFPQPTYVVDEFSWTTLKLSYIQLEPEGISTIDGLTAYFSPLDLLLGRANHIVVTNPDIIQDVEDTGPAGLGGLPDLLAKFSLQAIPTDTLDVDNLKITLASEDVNPEIQGKINLLTEGDGTRKLTIHLESEQKDLSLSGNGWMTEDRAGNQKLVLEIPEARFDIPGLRLSRANGKFTLTRKIGMPVAIEGELAAGALKIGTLPLDGITLVATGRKPDLSIIGNATVTGIPLTNLSLRMAEDAKGASMLLQLSGESPKWLAEQMVPGIESDLPEQQKYAIAVDIRDKDLLNLFKAPYAGGVFLYLSDPAPLLAAPLNCTDTVTCKATLAATPISFTHFQSLFAKDMAGQDLKLSDGKIKVSGTAQSGRMPDSERILLQIALEAAGDNISGSWRTAKFSDGGFEYMQRGDGAFTLANTSARTLGGRITIPRLEIAADGTGQGEFKFSGLDAQQLAKIAGISGLSVTGQADASLNLKFEDGHATLAEGSNLSATNGLITYAPAQYPGFLNGEEQRLQVLREALKSYSYETLTLTGAGPLNETLSGKLSAKGKNAALFGDRSVVLDLNIESGLSTGLTRMVPNFSPD